MSNGKSSEYNGPERRRYTSEPWHLDKRIPITLILAILIQTGGAFWWAGKMDERIRTLEDKLVATTSMVVPRSEIEQRFKTLEIQLISNKESVDIVRNRLNSIDSKLDRLIERSKK